jgi:ABC-type nitrate/sulfonate/bicarbonate transport system substrate-binding protein
MLADAAIRRERGGTDVGRTSFLAVILLALALALAGVAAGCGGDDDEPEEAAVPTEEAPGEETEAEDEQPPDQPVRIRMGWGIPAEEIKYVMMHRPEAAEHMGTWYEIEWNQFAGTALGVQGLAAGTLDCATVGSLSVANGLDQGADIVIIGEFIEERSPDNFSTAWIVTEDSGIESLEDLRGKTVATSAIGGSTDYIQDFHIEQEAGLRAGQDYEKVELPFSQQQEALFAGRIDMGLFPQPFYGAVHGAGDVRDIFRLTDVQNPFVQLLNGCRREFLEQNGPAMQKFLEDWTNIANWILEEDNRDQVIEATEQATQIPAEVLERFLITEDDFFRPENGAVNISALQENWDFFREQGGIQQELQVRDHVIEEFLPPGSE